MNLAGPVVVERIIKTEKSSMWFPIINFESVDALKLLNEL